MTLTDSLLTPLGAPPRLRLVESASHTTHRLLNPRHRARLHRAVGAGESIHTARPRCASAMASVLHGCKEAAWASYIAIPVVHAVTEPIERP